MAAGSDNSAASSLPPSHAAQPTAALDSDVRSTQRDVPAADSRPPTPVLVADNLYQPTERLDVSHSTTAPPRLSASLSSSSLERLTTCTLARATDRALDTVLLGVHIPSD